MSDPSDRRQCKATSKRSGNRCKRPPMAGQLVCAMHGGLAPQALNAAARRVALGEALAELDRLGVPIDVDPAEAMVAMVHEAAGNVAFLRSKVQELTQRAGEADPTGLTDLGGGIAGRVDPDNWKAAPHVYVAMYDAERERLVRWSKACREAGVDEQRVRLAEQQGELIADGFRMVLDGMRAALLERGAPVDVVDVVWREAAPAVVAGALTAASTAAREAG